MITIQTLLVLLLSISAFAFEVPTFTPNVVDETSTLSVQEKEQINIAIDDAQKKGVLAAVYLTSRIGDETIEDVAEKVFKKWELGEKGKDNGVLIIVAVADRKMRIEVGYGLEGSIPDSESSRVIDEILKPNFRENNFAKGITEAVSALGLLASGEFPSYSQSPEDKRLSDPAIKNRLYLWLLALWGIPALIGTIFSLIGLIKNPELLDKMKARDNSSLFWRFLGIPSKGGLFLKLFLTLNPGLFIVLFPPLFGEPDITNFMNVAGIVCAVLFVLVAFYQSLALVSVRRFQRSTARMRLDKFRRKKAAGSTYTMFGRTYSVPTRSSSSGSSRSSSSSSSSSRSSSSSGGRSGGGGSSGSW